MSAGISGSSSGWPPNPVALPGAIFMRAKTAFVSTGSPGLTRRPMSGGSAMRGPSSSPMPRIIRARRMRQTGTSAPVAFAASKRSGSSRRKRIGARKQPQRRRRVRRTAAKARRDGQTFDKMKGAEFRAGKTFGEMMRRAQNKIVFNAARGRRRRPLDRKGKSLPRSS